MWSRWAFATVRNRGRLGVTLGLALVALLAGTTSHAAPASAQEVLALVRQQKLATSPAWHRLLRYQPRTDGRWRSQIDGEESFLARGGRSDPEAELDATVRAFFAPSIPGREDLHALCRFPARRRWLDAQLGFSRVPPVACPALERFVAQLDAESVTLVYASSFVENPASAFGHTFLRVGKRRGASEVASSEPEAADRRDHGIDYTATTDTDNPLLYAFKGVAGLFPGLFRFRTYDVMLREYGAYEGRDLWEYELALSPTEVELLVLHLWELDHARLDYFYATENCSYQLLAVLDAAAPRLDLVQGLKGAVFPLDTAQAVHAWPGLVKSVVYRPSVRSQLRASLAKLGERDQDLVDALARDADAPLPVHHSASDAARVLDAARLLVDLHHAKSMGDGRDPAAQARRTRLVERRAALPAGGHDAPAAAETGSSDKPPHESHGSMRLLFGTGMTTQYGTGFATLGYRFALHDLADPPDGQPELLQLQFLDLRVRYDHGRREVTLDALTFAELLALNPLSRFEKKLSWRVRAFGTRLHDRAAPDAFAHGVEAAVGATLGTETDHLVVFVMADAYVAFAEGVDGIGGSPVRPGVGPFGGLRVRLPARSVGLVTGSVSYLPAQRLDATFDVRASWRMGLSKDVAMGLEGSAQPRALELTLGSFVYF